ncbi:two-component sensor histidine kinase [Sphaerisporangium rufum]|uniref:histidine kinase n=1 Tax=Sphaerisporangium rufum TaxID=1381558 RepID=A0A919R138_9ACTN|nr:histidine kinase [Sphaerisporangium rufum]GII75095.1 two-component sensor histidine kinase [Sphaerisporangium rufum]
MTRRPWWHYATGALVAAYVLGGMVVGMVETVLARGLPGGALSAVLYLAGTACWLAALRGAGRTGDAALLAAATLAALVLNAVTPYSGLGVLFVTVWTAPFRMRLWQAVVLAVGGVIGHVLVAHCTGLPSNATLGVAAGLGWSVFFAAGIAQIAETRRQAAAVARARSREAVLAERQRLAREIHDILAHALSAQILHLEGARLLLQGGGERERVLDRVNRASDMARAGLEEARRAVAALRGERVPLADELARLAEGFRTATGARCTVTVHGDPEALASEARLAVIRTAQEALTNVQKHAPAAEVEIVLRCGAAGSELEVRDTGVPGTAAAAPGGGYGLTGMRERAELIGGSLAAGPDGPGFAVRLRVPA